MQPDRIGRRLGGFGLLLAFALALSGCLFAPGKFVSELDIRKDGTFRFSYVGEIHVIALSRVAETINGTGSGSATFSPSTCYEADNAKERKCSSAELAEQKRQWEESRATSAERRARDAESMKAAFGGIDPSDPRAAEELAQRLRRQAGWRRVVHKGDGLFDVDFAISGRLGHDFTFPTIERFPTSNPFVQVLLRADRTVRIDAPAFAPAAAGDPYRGMMQAAALGEARNGTAKLPEMDGTFAIVTDAALLANNTDSGPQPFTTGQRLEWKVNARSAAAPTALLQLARP